ncbi:uncharacterized protein J4E79_003436 [Alternaria viburni]|uniref:uncharacterized protein n=1 Tax=Alternaria viburni TaxID=566460 RepID=UPI0020C45B8C|nr:uncharacterized protein J4E79_003436 [Alternaria viburni]KAI4663936.1 hypothetical protein J4E79_003436 [Alternaria viburni]
MAGHSLLDRLHPLIVQNKGARHEAEIFDALIEHPRAVRSFEFAPVDGAIDCGTQNSPLGGTYSERFWELDQLYNELHNELDTASGDECMALTLFDAKGKESGSAQNQIYVTALKQRNLVQFYICMCAANPGFVELYPNYYAGSLTAGDDPGRYVAVNLSRKSIVGPESYRFLSPCNAPYRMPIALLTEAISRIRACVMDPESVYANPYTNTRFPQWRPSTVTTNKYLMPEESTQHATGFIGLVDIWRGIRVAKTTSHIDMDFDFVNLQPRLADFKLLLPSCPPTPTRRQVFVQYKIDAVQRARHNTKIAIGRTGNIGTHWYFTDTERFDFLWYEFRYTESSTKVLSKEFYFIPECELSDTLYTSLELHVTLDKDRFRHFHSSMDVQGDWRPSRPQVLEDYSQTPTPDRKVNSVRPRDSKWFSRKFFHGVMTQCALRRKGLLVVLSPQFPMPNFAFCRYQWTQDDAETYLRTKIPPLSLSDLGPSTPVVLTYAITKYKAGSSRGPILTPFEFKRLDAWTECQVLFFDMFGRDGKDILGPLIAIPSDDVSISEEHRQKYKVDLGKSTRTDYLSRSPLLAQQLHTRYTLADYTLSTLGPMIFEETAPQSQWSDVWELLDACSGVASFAFPPGAIREPHKFRVTIQDLHQRLADYHASVEGRQLLAAHPIDGSQVGDEEDEV